MIKKVITFMLLWFITLTLTFAFIVPRTALYKSTSPKYEQIITEKNLNLPLDNKRIRHGFTINYLFVNNPGFMFRIILIHTLLLGLLFVSVKRLFKASSRSVLFSEPLESFKNILSNLFMFTFGVINKRASRQLQFYFKLPVQSRTIALLAYALIFFAIALSYNVPERFDTWQFAVLLYFKVYYVAILLLLVFFWKPFRKNFEQKLFWLSLSGLLISSVLNILYGLYIARTQMDAVTAKEISYSTYEPKEMIVNFLIVLAFSFYIEVLKQVFTQKARSDAEMDVARRIQQELLPVLEIDNGYFSLYGQTEAANEVGGDYCDAIELPDGRYAVAVGDVSGHNVAAGVMMSMLKVAFRTELVYLSDPLEQVASLNRTIYNNKNRNMFISFLFALVGPDQKELVLFNCGHPPLLHVDSKENSVHEYRTGDAALGLQQDAVFHSQTIVYKPGDVFVLTSDGLMETVKHDGSEFGLERVHRLLAEDHNGTPIEIYEKITRAADDFQGKQPQRDDVTIVVMKMK